MELRFTVKTKDLKNALNKIFSLSRRSKTTQLKISVREDLIAVEAQGLTLTVKAETIGIGEVLLPAQLFRGYAQTASASVISFTFRSGELECGSSLFHSSAIEVSESFAQLKNDVPFNLTPFILLRYTAGKSTQEIKELGLSGRVQYARQVLHDQISAAVEVLSPYNVTFDELKELIEKKFKGE
jgi:hypothetical protein